MIPSRFLIGVDSDGTAFDSMNHKHLDALIPAALEVWRMEREVANRFTEIYKSVNLYSATRGINRFPGLLEVFERLKKEYPNGKNMPELDMLREYVNENSRYSTASLQDWMIEHPSSELSKVLAWSIRANVIIARACEGILPYEGVIEALAEAGEKATVAVVSAAVKEELEKDWIFAGLMSHVDVMMGQEDGFKPEQLQRAIDLSGADYVLMIGDAEMDAEAARAVDGMFYPIVPGKEAECWQTFRDEVLPMFLKGQYGKEEEAKYYEPMKAMLKEE